MGPTWVRFGHHALILPIWDPFANACWVGFILALDQTKIYKIGMLRIPLNQNENSKLVKHHNDNTSPGLGRGADTREVTQSSNSSVEEMRESGRSFQSLVFWGKPFLKGVFTSREFLKGY